MKIIIIIIVINNETSVFCLIKYPCLYPSCPTVLTLTELMGVSGLH